MDAKLSRLVGAILGSASPPPTYQERQAILKELETANKWSELPPAIRNRLADMRRSANGKPLYRRSV